MHKYIIRRTVAAIPTLLILSLLLFGLLRVLPGDVAEMFFSSGFGLVATEDVVDALRERLGLNRPLHIQYLTWLWDSVRGDLGVSMWTGKSVGGEILHRLPLTLQIAVMAKALSLLIGIPIGVLSALRQNSWLDYTLRFWSIFFLAAPTFWLGLLALLAGVFWFNWSPPVGYNVLWENPKENVLQLMWPTVILASHGLATIARMTRSTMLEVLREDYIRTARCKGLAEWVVVTRHALKNALIPVVTLAGLSFGHLLGGTVILELVFSIPGIGWLFIDAINIRDYAVVQGVVIVLAAMFMAVNLAVDLLYGWLDPRISYS